MIMTTAVLLEEIKGALAEVLNTEAREDIQLSTSLFDELYLDSTSVLELLMTLEDRIEGLEIDPDDLEPDVFDTVGSLAAYIEKQAHCGLMASPVAIREMGVRLFSEKKPPFDHPELLRFHQDMLAGTPVKYDVQLLQGRNNNAYHEMSVELLEETGLDRVMQDVDVLLLAYNFPNTRPDISIVNYLMDRYQARFISFAVNDLGFGAPFAALHMLQHYLGREGYMKGMLLVMDQTALPYETMELVSPTGPDTAAAIYLDRMTGVGPSLLGVEMRHAEHSVADTAEMVLDRLCAQASIHRNQINLLIHPDLEQPVQSGCLVQRMWIEELL